ncbi:MAG: XdhC family protein [Rhodospirillaceae bacterium]|jgi:xanthine dehydrogenase accessory factor|nr:XdhC family protein [Rhodospirillaceae bacterium]MBT6117965.1 XdhC family protein [Rhodospirillaceae bacterium]
MKRETLQSVLAARRDKRPLALATEVETGEQALVDGEIRTGDLVLAGAALDAVRAALAEDRSGMIETEAGRLFVQVFNPPLRMIIVGAVHIAQALVPMATIAGYDVTVIDPRRAFATDARFPGTTVLTDWPDDAMTGLAPDRRTAIVTLTHDPKIDDPALAVAVRSPAFYIAALGSRRTHAKRVERLAEAGFSDDEIGRIAGPAGLPIGARSPAEIALSVLAECTAALHGVAAR